MNLTAWERLQKAQDLIEKRQATVFLGTALTVAVNRKAPP